MIPLTNGLEVRVILGGTMAGTCRALIETPLEYAKVNYEPIKLFIVFYLKRKYIIN